MADAMIHDFLLGFIRILVLHYSEKQPIYGKEFHDILSGHGYEVSYGTLYPLFHTFEKKGYLECETRTVGGKVRKYYSITELGRESLASARNKSR